MKYGSAPTPTGVPPGSTPDRICPIIKNPVDWLSLFNPLSIGTSYNHSFQRALLCHFSNVMLRMEILVDKTGIRETILCFGWA